MHISVDYQNSILSISNSVLKYFNKTAPYASLPELDTILNKNYKNVVLLILDCMGTEILRKNLPLDSFLNRHILKNVSSVFPPTTVAATTAFHSALPPLRSGWLGWMCYFEQYDKIIEIFRQTEFYSGAIVPPEEPYQNLIKYQSIYEQIVEKNPDVEYVRIFPPFDPNGVNSFQEMCQKIVETTKKSSAKKIISAYWTEPDHSIHMYGTSAATIKLILKDIEQQIIQMNEKLEDTVVIISADHGAVDVQETNLTLYPDFCNTFLRPPALEARFVTFFIKPGKHDIFKNLFEKYFGDDFVLFSKQDFLDSHILGTGEMHPMVPSFLGDFIAIGIKNKTLRYDTDERNFPSFVADHAGFSPDEMTVPLIVLEKKS